MNSIVEDKMIGRGLSENSLKLYEANLKRLNGGHEIKNLNFLKDTESIIKQIKEKKDTTARSYVIAICSILKNDLKMKKPYDIYYNLLIEYNDKLKNNNTKSEKQSEEWITQDEVKKKYDAADAAGETQEQVSINPLIKYIADHETEIATNNAPVLANLKMQLAKLGAADTLSIYDLEQLRKSANKISFPGSGVNEVYMGELRPLFERITEGKGGDLYKAARAENTKYATEFKDHAVISKLLRNKPGTKDRAVAFEDIYKHVVHTGSLDDLQLVKNTLLKAGDEGEFAWNQIRAQAADELKQRAMSNISKDAAGNPIPNAKALRTATAQLDRDGKLDLLFGKDEAKRIRELVQLGGDIYSPVPGTISPGTASVLIRSLDAIAKNAVISRIPVVRSVASGAAEMAAKKGREKRVSEAVNYNALIP
jgi:hypothetical protein